MRLSYPVWFRLGRVREDWSGAGHRRGAQMRVEVGVGAGSALVPPWGLGSEPSRLAPYWRTPITITRTTTRTAPTVTTLPPRHTIRRHRIIHPHGAVGTPITDTITLA